ncbi:hypothetical protein L596_013907 [Steinernema carpocapsae]|uniref:Uncharacterized protein n=1 Tax=Steinernema carpocapsae TaxID=34508 RepID=A0A4U5P1L9_STECR|nr:hypothetical protein L596_013907 [Steinernema carpocapsae]
MLWNDSQIAVQVALAQLFFVVVTLTSCSRKKDTTNETSIEKDRVKAVKSVPVSPQANMSENDLKRQSSPSKGEIINDKGRAKVERSVRVSIKANMSEDDFKGPSKEEITNDKISMAESKRPQTTQDISKTEGKEKKKKDKKLPPKPKISPGRKVEEKTSGVSITKDGIDTRLLMESTAAASNNSMKTQETKEDATNLTKLTSASQARTSTASGSRTNKGDVDHTQNSPSSKAKLKR